LKKTVLLSFVFLLFSTAVTIRFVRPVVAEETIYIRPDGTVEETDKIQRDGNVYTFTDNIFNQSIIVERDNIVVDGAGYTLQGTGAISWPSRVGMTLHRRSNVTVKNIEIKVFFNGIVFDNCSNNIIYGSRITNNILGIDLSGSDNIISGNNLTNNNDSISLSGSDNIISGNKITANNRYSIWLLDSSDNIVSGNNLTNNNLGIWLDDSSSNRIQGNKIGGNDSIGIKLSDSSGNSISGNNLTTNSLCMFLQDSAGNIISGNTMTKSGRGVFLFSGFHPTFNNKFYHNNFISNNEHVSFSPILDNSWDNGFEGNYWSDYDGTDLNQDGIGDTPYIINTDNQDNYPLMGRYYDFPISNIVGHELEETFHMSIICNSTVTDSGVLSPIINLETGEWEGGLYILEVTGSEGTKGFCRFTIPKNLLNSGQGSWTVYVNGTKVTFSCNIWDNSTHTFIYVPYNHSTLEITIFGWWIVPEFPTWTSILLIIIVLTVALAIYKRARLFWLS